MVSRKMTTWIAALALTLIVALGTTPSAEAVASITFDQVVTGGAIAYPVLGGALVGEGILFDFFVVAGTGATDGVYACSGCVMGFVTGPAFGDTDGPIYTFAGGGAFILVGGVPAMGIPDGSLLLSGFFTASPINAAVAAGDTVIFEGSGNDTKNADLTAFLGIDPDQWRATHTEFSLGAATINPDGTFFGTITQADLQNIKVVEPASTLLLLLGIGSLAAYRRRR